MTAGYRSMRTRTTLISVLVLLGLTLGAAWWLVAPVLAASPTEDTAVEIRKVAASNWYPTSGEPLFIAVLGSDTRNGPPSGGGGRCDAIHIVAINPQEKAGTILNIPRDTYVAVPGMGRTKINAACTRGAPTMVQALQNHTGLPIHYYAITEFSNFVALINETGAINVPVPYAMRDSPSGAHFPQGNALMNGTQALAFSRNRKDTPRGDFSRTENQGIFMKAMHTKFREETAMDLHRVFDYIKAARRHVQTDVPVSEIVQLAMLARDIDPADIANLTIPGSTGMAGRASVVFPAPGDIYTRVKDDGIY
ncbi:MAG: LCP family protein [Actinomycetota bacterium]